MHDKRNWTGADGLPVKIDSTLLLDFLREQDPQDLDLEGEFGGYLRSLFFWCKPEDADGALALFAKCKGSNGARNLSLQSLISSAYGDGSIGSIDKVYQSVAKNLGTGTSAERAVMALFSKAGVSTESMELLSGLKQPNLRKMALAGIAYSLSSGDSLSAAILNLDLQKMDKDLQQALTEGLAHRVGSSKALGISAAELLNEGLRFIRTPAGLADYFERCVQSAPDAVWKALLDKGAELDPEKLALLQKTAIATISRDDPNGALERALKVSDEKSRHELLTLTTLEYLKLNDVAASTWLAEHKSGLADRDLDAVEAAHAQMVAEKGGFPDAWARLDSIADAEIRRKAEGAIWSRERRAVLAQSRLNPGATTEAIVSGASQHAPYWIETSMTEWVAQDSEAAWNWYQGNQRKLTPEQNEAVALTYARLALKDGDVDVASQWAAQVVTPKFKEKIAAEIEAADR